MITLTKQLIGDKFYESEYLLGNDFFIGPKDQFRIRKNSQLPNRQPMPSWYPGLFVEKIKKIGFYKNDIVFFSDTSNRYFVINSYFFSNLKLSDTLATYERDLVDDYTLGNTPVKDLNSNIIVMPLRIYPFNSVDIENIIEVPF